MKLVLLAAAAALAVPAVAQTTTDTQTDTSAQTQDQAQDQTAAPADQAAPAADQSAMPADQSAMGSAAPTAGGYQPANPPMANPASPGATVQFVPSQSPDQAYPAPAAQASYPWCKPGQFDNCRERENGRGQGLHPQHRR